MPGDLSPPALLRYSIEEMTDKERKHDMKR